MTGSAAMYATGRSESSAGGPPANPFARTAAVTLPCREHCAGLDVFAATPERVQRYFDEATGKAVYVAGRVSHPSLSGDALLRWCLRTAESDPAALRSLLGAFVLIIDDRNAGRVTFITDPLGLLPWFVGSSQGRLVSGSDALGICDAGLSTGEVDYDSVASWLCYNFISTGGSVVRDYRRLPGGTVSTFDRTGRLETETRYAALKYVRDVLPPEELVEGLMERVRAAFEVLTRGVDEVNLPLSGGYDSRLLCALAAEHGRPRVRVTVVESTPGESLVARRVADALGVPLHALPVGAANIDLFDDPLYFMPEGFPVARNLTNAVARLHPGLPVLSGFMGDAIMRGPMNPTTIEFLAQDFKHLGEEQYARAADERFRIRTNRLHLLRDAIAPRAEARARASLLPLIRAGQAAGRPLAFTNLQLRHRLYFAGIFLSHLDVADALLPFTSWDLVSFHASHTGSFQADTYDRLFQRFFPKLAGIPHDTQVESPSKDAAKDGPPPPPRRPSRHLRRWGWELLSDLPRTWSRSAITPRKLIRRLPGALSGQSRYADEVGYLHRIRAFEERLGRANLRLDWESV